MGAGFLPWQLVRFTPDTPIVGYSIDARMTAQLAVSALRNAIALRDPREPWGCIQILRQPEQPDHEPAGVDTEED
jgi:hypothetical protein